MDSTIKGITFSHEGECSFCKKYDKEILPVWKSEKFSESELSKVLKNIKNNSSRYNCIIGMSGGVDSSYAAYLAVKKGLRPLAVHVDGGWNSEAAVSNIEKITKKLKIDLITFVVDWSEMKDLQKSFFLSGEMNCDIPQDHAFVAALFKIAYKHNIKAFITGYNYATESTTGSAGGHTYTDLSYILDIHSKFGNIPLKKYPTMGLLNKRLRQEILKYKYVDILNYVDFNKEDAKALLIKEFGWKDYGGKHHESEFTKFFQNYYLPKKYNYDKRKSHLTSLIHSEQISRYEAIKELNRPLYDNLDMQNEKDFVLRKLSISDDEWKLIMKTEAKPEKYKSDFNKISYKVFKNFKNLLLRMNSYK
jgi:aminotransferase